MANGSALPNFLQSLLAAAGAIDFQAPDNCPSRKNSLNPLWPHPESRRSSLCTSTD